MQACWTVGYALGEIPSNLLLTRIRPRYWLPAMEVCTAAALPALDICLMIAFRIDHMDDPHVLVIEMSHTGSNIYFEILHRYCLDSSFLVQFHGHQGRANRHFRLILL
jgi:hypothetical protein